MARVRRLLASLSIVWLSCQLTTDGLALAGSWQALAAEAIASCTCSHGPDAACPMHYAPAKDPKRCVMQNEHDTAVLTLTSLLGVIGIVPAPAMVRVHESSRLTVRSGRQPIAEHPVPPDPPPPRA